MKSLVQVKVKLANAKVKTDNNEMYKDGSLPKEVQKMVDGESTLNEYRMMYTVSHTDQNGVTRKLLLTDG